LLLHHPKLPDIKKHKQIKAAPYLPLRTSELNPVTKFAPHGLRLGDRIGNTPLLRFERVTSDLADVQVLAKAEWANPGGSVKDRAACNIIEDALRSGRLTPGKVLLDSTSGNTGIAYAMLGAAYGIAVTLCMPSNVSSERKKVLNAYGATIVYTDPGEGSDGAIVMARKMASAEPDKYVYVDQYSNAANWRAHYENGTGDEIWRQTDGRITHFVAMLGTSGTFVGTSRRLKELKPSIQCISLQPDSPFHGIEGGKHMESSIVPNIYDPEIADGDIGIRTEDAHAMVMRLAREEGLLVGVSSGAAMVGALEVARSAPAESVVVTVFPDSGERYLSEHFWEEPQKAGE
jgi:S-sulfo-L-cysteine synthase (O-acetyl-L-serine-dependent)